jgi:hypothetical protein
VPANNSSRIGEMYNLPQKPDAMCLLPREGGVAYAAQESWVLNDTIKVNIFTFSEVVTYPKQI